MPDAAEPHSAPGAHPGAPGSHPGAPGSLPGAPGSLPEAELTSAEAENLKTRARWGVVLLLGRTVVLQLGIFVANLFLARLLEPAEFGAFAVVQFLLTLFNFFGDAGLGPALIQRKQEPSRRQLSSVFCAQTGIALVVVTLLWILAKPVCSLWEELPPSAPWLLRALGIALLLTTLRVMPSILMERHLQFGRLAGLEVAVTLSFYLSAIVLAVLDFGVWALVGSVVVQAVVGVVLAYILRPWKPGLALDIALLKPVLRFGIPFQAKNAVGFANGAIAPVYAGAKLGVDAVGYINFAQSTAYFPLKLVEVMARVTFPLYSRLQNDKALLTETLGRSIHICAAGTFFMVALFLGLGEPIIRIMYTDKWLPSLPLLYIFTGAIAFGFIAPVLAAALDAIGKPELFFKLSIGWTALNWIIVPITTPLWGIIGFTGGYAVHVVVGNIVVIFVAKRLFPQLAFFRRVMGSVVAGAVVWQFGSHFLEAWATSGWRLLAAVSACVVVYAMVILAVDRGRLIDAFGIVPRKGETSPTSATSAAGGDAQEEQDAAREES